MEMNKSGIEKYLRETPQPEPPAGLLSKLQMDLPAVDDQRPHVSPAVSFRRIAIALSLVMIVTVSGLGIYSWNTQTSKPKRKMVAQIISASYPATVETIWEKPGRTEKITSSIPIGNAWLRDENLKKFAMTGVVFRGILKGLEAYRIDHNNQAPETIDQLTTPTNYIGTATKDPFGTGDVKYLRQNDEIFIYSVGPDGKWDGGKTMNISDPKLSGDIGIAFNIKTGKTKNLFDYALAPYIQGKRLPLSQDIPPKAK